jgi:hypothetical protein
VTRAYLSYVRQRGGTVTHLSVDDEDISLHRRIALAESELGCSFETLALATLRELRTTDTTVRLYSVFGSAAFVIESMTLKS